MNDPHPVKVLRGATSFSSRRCFPVFRARGWHDDLGFRVMRAPGAPAAWCVLRGGSWNFDQGDVRADCRYFGRPGFRFDYSGFRVMRRSL
jgi:hypothetical protein